ncbi:39S ribosomal protein L35, mitochondrial [Aricia agestis]|uniref:39S ribosomal protein L35, mitochondrial n=1 Tax=Aricia agestis TaxID=91739 RepID=UPI001C2084EB|nr:39S ribosomal protein L35, mitochondrial [Aricia agestis]
MLRSAILACRVLQPLQVARNVGRVFTYEYKRICTPNLKNISVNYFSSVNIQPLVNNKQILDISSNITAPQVRSVTKFSLRKGKRKSVKVVLKKFFRLHWGAWIRTKAGRNKRRWKKSLANQRRARQHVLCNSTQSYMLDKMVTNFWKKPKHYVEDPYAPYHTREEFIFTKRKPRIVY